MAKMKTETAFLGKGFQTEHSGVRHDLIFSLHLGHLKSKNMGQGKEEHTNTFNFSCPFGWFGC